MSLKGGRRSSTCPNLNLIIPKKSEAEFLDDLIKHHKKTNTHFTFLPTILGRRFSLKNLYYAVLKNGGSKTVNEKQSWNTILEELQLPKTCSNSEIALKRIYQRYLEPYEKSQFSNSSHTMSELDYLSSNNYNSSLHSASSISDFRDPELRLSMRQPGSFQDIISLHYRYALHNIPPEKRSNLGMSSDLIEPGELRLLEQSLHSGLPNEVELSLNTLLVLSRGFPIRLERCHQLLELLLGLVGVYDPSPVSYYLLHDDWRRQSDRNFFRFWNQHVKSENGRQYLHLNLLDSGDSLLEDNSTPVEDYLNLNDRDNATDTEFHWVLIVAAILRNLAQTSTNANLIASNPTALRFLLLCLNCESYQLRNCSQEIFSELPFNLNNSPDRIRSIVIDLINTLLKSEDRAAKLTGLRLLCRICSSRANMTCELPILTDESLNSVISSCLLPDVTLLVSALDSCYQLTCYSQVMCHRLGSRFDLLNVLMAFLSREAQSLGTSAIYKCMIMQGADASNRPAIQQPNHNSFGPGWRKPPNSFLIPAPPRLRPPLPQPVNAFHSPSVTPATSIAYLPPPLHPPNPIPPTHPLRCTTPIQMPPERNSLPIVNVSSVALPNRDNSSSRCSNSSVSTSAIPTLRQYLANNMRKQQEMQQNKSPVVRTENSSLSSLPNNVKQIIASHANSCEQTDSSNSNQSSPLPPSSSSPSISQKENFPTNDLRNDSVISNDVPTCSQEMPQFPQNELVNCQFESEPSVAVSRDASQPVNDITGAVTKKNSQPVNITLAVTKENSQPVNDITLAVTKVNSQPVNDLTIAVTKDASQSVNDPSVAVAKENSSLSREVEQFNSTPIIIKPEHMEKSNTCHDVKIDDSAVFKVPDPRAAPSLSVCLDKGASQRVVEWLRQHYITSSDCNGVFRSAIVAHCQKVVGRHISKVKHITPTELHRLVKEAFGHVDHEKALLSGGNVDYLYKNVTRQNLKITTNGCDSSKRSTLRSNLSNGTSISDRLNRNSLFRRDPAAVNGVRKRLRSQFSPEKMALHECSEPKKLRLENNNYSGIRHTRPHKLVTKMNGIVGLNGVKKDALVNGHSNGFCNGISKVDLSPSKPDSPIISQDVKPLYNSARKAARLIARRGRPFKRRIRRRPYFRSKCSAPSPTKSTPPVLAAAHYFCEWNQCTLSFATQREVFHHVYFSHLTPLRSFALTTRQLMVCQWTNCEQAAMPRGVFSLIGHVTESHCSERALLNALNRRSCPHMYPPVRQVPNFVLNDSAWSAIRRTILHEMPQSAAVMPVKEGPVTKHMRLTAALILKNLAKHSRSTRNCIRYNEGHILDLIMSGLDCSRILSDCLFECEKYSLTDLNECDPPHSPPSSPVTEQTKEISSGLVSVDLDD